MTEPSRPDAMAHTLDLSAHVGEIEQCLTDLDAALVAGDTVAVDKVAQQLQRSLADSLAAFRHAVAEGRSPISPELRQRLVLAQSRVMSQQATVHKAGAAIERTLDILLPREDSPTYGASGTAGSSRVAAAYRS